jgi:hypothetical protein
VEGLKGVTLATMCLKIKDLINLITVVIAILTIKRKGTQVEVKTKMKKLLKTIIVGTNFNKDKTANSNNTTK